MSTVPSGLLYFLLFVSTAFAIAIYLGIVVEITPVPKNIMGLLWLLVFPAIQVIATIRSLEGSIWQTFLSLFVVEALGLFLYIFYLLVSKIKNGTRSQIISTFVLVAVSLTGFFYTFFLPLFLTTEGNIRAFWLLLSSSLYITIGHALYSIRSKGISGYILLGLAFLVFGLPILGLVFFN